MSFLDFLNSKKDKEDVSIDPLSEEKKHLEIQKLKTDTKLAELSLNNFKRSQTLEMIKIIISFSTIFAIALTFLTQQTQLKVQQEQLQILTKEHIDDAIAKDIQQLASSSSEASKVVALSKLATYFKLNDSTIDNQLINLFLNYGQLDTLLSVKAFIEKSICDNVPKRALTYLVEMNKEMDGGSELTSEVNLNKLKSQLRWNNQCILKCLNKMKYVENFDFSNTTLAFENLGDIQNVNFKNVLFQNVDFTYGTFRNDTLNDVKFINCTINVEFYQCQLSKCIMKNVEISDGIMALKFIQSNLNFLNFSPDCYSIFKHDLFIDSRWTIDAVDEKSKSCFSYPLQGIDKTKYMR